MCKDAFQGEIFCNRTLTYGTAEKLASCFTKGPAVKIHIGGIITAIDDPDEGSVTSEMEGIKCLSPLKLRHFTTHNQLHACTM